MDSTVIRAHQHSAGKKGSGDSADQALGRSRGGLTTKVHMGVNRQGEVVRIQLSAGQRSDISQADALISGLSFDVLIADKGYDSDSFIEKVKRDQGAEIVIPPRKNRREPREVDLAKYREQNVVERFFNRVKHFRRVATRYDKTARNYLAFWHLACMHLLLR